MRFNVKYCNFRFLQNNIRILEQKITTWKLGQIWDLKNKLKLTINMYFMYCNVRVTYFVCFYFHLESVYTSTFHFLLSNHQTWRINFCLFLWCRPSITDGVHRNENLVEIIPVFSTFFNFFKKRKKKYIRAILCNFSMRLLKYFWKIFKEFFCPPKHRKTSPKSCS